VGTLASELRSIAAGLAAVPRIYADANLPAGVVVAMRQELHWDVLFVLEDDELRRAPDREHYRRARELGRTLITLDRDFFDDTDFPIADSPGVVVLSAPNEAGLIRLLRQLDRDVLRAADAGETPLAGRKLDLAPVPDTE
jgi:predicted nuclease of predicted toxin-antitoxin system